VYVEALSVGGGMAGGTHIRRARSGDLEAINIIYNHEVEHGVATWDLEPWTLQERVAWFEEHDDQHPVFVAVVADEIAGFAYLSRYRSKAGYRFTCEDTLYVGHARRRAGIGRALLARLVEAAAELRLHSLVAWIEAENEISIRLHEDFGFRRIGGEYESGFKFGRWLSNVELQLIVPPQD
jgi:phosphinothricin acetyltransferase